MRVNVEVATNWGVLFWGPCMMDLSCWIHIRCCCFGKLSYGARQERKVGPAHNLPLPANFILGPPSPPHIYVSRYSS